MMKYKVEKEVEYTLVYYVEAESAEDAENKVDEMEGDICNEREIETIVDELTDEQWKDLQ